jgi:hypothetical protein
MNLMKIIEIITNFDFWGNFTSILGFIFTIFVFLSVKQIKSFYIRAARVPELKLKLEDLASKMINLLKDFPSTSRDLECELARIGVVLNSLNKKLGRNKSSAGKAVRIINDFFDVSSNNQSVDIKGKQLDSIYTLIQKVIIEVEELEKDREWER